MHFSCQELPCGHLRYDMSLSVSCQRVKRLPHRNEAGIQINMQSVANHVAAYKLAHRPDKANPWSDFHPTLSRIVIQYSSEMLTGTHNALRIKMLYWRQNRNSYTPPSPTSNAWKINGRTLMCGDRMIVKTTDRLRLVAGTKVLAAAEIEDRAEFAKLLGALVPETWPSADLRDVLGYFQGLYEKHPCWESWLTWYAIRIDGDYPVLCGSIGFKGPPDKQGMVEIGFSVPPEFQGQGLATEMVAGMVQWAKQQPKVRQIEAETNIDNKAAIRVLEKNSFIHIGVGLEPHTIRFLHQP